MEQLLNSNTTLVKVKYFIFMSEGLTGSIQIQLLLKLNVHKTLHRTLKKYSNTTLVKVKLLGFVNMLDT